MSIFTRWRDRRDAELARRTDQAARTKGTPELFVAPHPEIHLADRLVMPLVAVAGPEPAEPAFRDEAESLNRRLKDLRHYIIPEPDREYVTRLWAEDWDSAEDRTADPVNPPHTCQAGYACYDHQERRS